ncbi:3'-5' exoribonuclease YhaM family protein [Alkalibacter mobilis]|uniref:3'-5' exoribonuclease YhaM family protein n=1 Tax=Alkalibacter mobilis TaxID=2787712 RepID=UPI00189D7003|nr:HD domain-containing protein [Alkalibacter mobilis]MBF7096697.1 HD domain-containing protein [Alkalibacter mobilis]
MINNISIKDMDYGQNVVTYMIVKNSDLKKAKNDSLYLDLILGDSHGNEASGKLWNASGDMAAFKTGDMVAIDALVQKFNGKLQLRLNKIRYLNEGDKVDVNDFVESAPETPEKMYEYMLRLLSGFENEELKLITEYLLEEKKEKLLYYPAAKTHHHAIKSGLLYHVTSMLKIAEGIIPIYPFVDKELLLAGIMLHDLSKVDEMQSNDMGLVEDYTKEGKLLGHIIQGIVDIDKAACELGISPELKLVLEHMILSHHYHAEYGSPKKPLVPEGELLHYIDLIDARMYAMDKVLKDVEPGQFGDRSMTLEGRNMYKANLSKE